MKDDCIFCKLANGIIPTRSIYEDENFKVILDAAPATRGHALILPKEHAANLYVVQNNGEIAGQTVFHFHIHLIPRYKDDQQNLTWEQHTYEDATMDEIEKILKEV